MERYIIPSVYQAIQLYRVLARAERGMSSLELEETLKFGIPLAENTAQSISNQ